MVPSVRAHKVEVRLVLGDACRDRRPITRAHPPRFATPRPGGGEKVVQIHTQRGLIESFEETCCCSRVNRDDAIDDLLPGQSRR